MKEINIKNPLFLFLAAVIWGTAFVAQKVGMDFVGPYTLNAIRFLIGSLVLVPVILILNRFKSAEKAASGDSKTLLRGGLVCGLVLFVASNLQQVGIQYTTAGKAGFITALYIILVPIFGIFLKKKAGIKLWISVIIAVVGLYLLCMTDRLAFELGDTYIIISAFIYAIHILVIDHYSPKVDGVKLSCLQFLISGVLSGICMLFLDPIPTAAQLFDCRVPILYMGIMSCGVAYTLQVLGQKNMNPTIASLIMSLESVVSVISAWIILNQGMSQRELIGCVLMFCAIILAQLPNHVRRRTKTACGELEKLT